MGIPYQRSILSALVLSFRLIRRQQIGNAPYDGIGMLTVRTEQRAGKHIPITLFLNGELQIPLAYRASQMCINFCFINE